MSILRYTASLDNTITNAFEENLTTRGTGSNMGLADTLEVFSIYAQATSASVELSRFLIQFPTSQISTDRTAGTLPASGSVTWKLKLYNAPHYNPVPRSFDLQVSAVSASWQEGTGLDMEGYTDLTDDGIGSNWINANGNITAATLVDAIDITGHANGDKFTMTVPTSAGGDGVTYTFLLDSTSNVNADTAENTFGISRQVPVDDAATALAIVDAINGVVNNAYKYGNADVHEGSSLAAGTIGLTAKIGTSSSKITLTMDVKSAVGNVANVLAAVVGFENDLLLESSFTGGDGKWGTIGGDYNSTIVKTQSLDTGLEDLEIDVSDIVEKWLLSSNPWPNYGFGVRLTDTYEGYFSSSTGENTATEIHNTSGAQDSYYTKKFFGRGTEFFFKRPILEAQFNDTKKDDRSNFILSSSVLPAADNLNKLYLYNYVRGRLRDVAGSDTAVVSVQLFQSSGSVPEGSAKTFKASGSDTGVTTLNATRESTGIYYVNIHAESSVVSTTYPNLVDVWTHSSAQFFTGSAFTPKAHSPYQAKSDKTYVMTMTNLRTEYRNDQTARLRVYAREKNWSPNIYTTANSTPENLTITSGSYRLLRIADELEVIPYGTGSVKYSELSYDVSGNYFDLDMSILEAGYQYGFKFSIYDDFTQTYVEQPYLFKFRVIK